MEFEFGKYIKSVHLYSLATAILIWLLSLPFAGINPAFAAGLIAGTATATVNFHLMYAGTEYALRNLKSAVIPLGSVGRLFIYGLVFVLAIKLSYIGAIGCAAGFMTDKLALIYLHLIKKVNVKSARQVPDDVKAHYEEIDKNREEKDKNRIF